jgi:hypothetical protein
MVEGHGAQSAILPVSDRPIWSDVPGQLNASSVRLSTADRAARAPFRASDMLAGVFNRKPLQKLAKIGLIG